MLNKVRLFFLSLSLVVIMTTAAQAKVFINGTKPEDWDTRKLFRITQANFAANDTMILECGDKVMLLDGGTRKFWKRLNRYLETRFNSHVNIIFNSHPHDDHVQGQFYLLKNEALTADVFYSTFEQDYNCDEQREIVGALEKAGIPYVQVFDGQHLDFGGADLTVMRWPDGMDRNARSGLLHVRFGEATILLTGDLSGQGQGWFAEYYTPEQLKVDILKAPHHGIMAMDRDFLLNSDPELVMITHAVAGSKELNAQLKKYGYEYVHATDAFAVVMETDGTDWYVERVKNLF